MNSQILAIVFLPLLAAIIGGLANKAAPAVFTKVLTTGALFVSCGLSWPISLLILPTPGWEFVTSHARFPPVFRPLNWRNIITWKTPPTTG